MNQNLKASIQAYRIKCERGFIEHSAWEIAKLELADALLADLGFPEPPVHCGDFHSGWPLRPVRPKAPTEPGFVYFMRNNRNGFIKIGYSKNPSARESTLQSQEPEVEIVAVMKGTRQDERAMHELFGLRRIRGEWFGITASDLLDINRRIAAME